MVYIEFTPIMKELVRWGLTAVFFILAMYAFQQAYKSYKNYKKLKEELKELNAELEKLRSWYIEEEEEEELE